MPKYLVVVESPAKAKTIKKFLGRNYTVKASYGHVRDLPKSQLGVDVDNNFEPKYVRPREASKAVKELKTAAKGVDEILLASDPDREGEAIGWHVAELLKPLEKPIQRIVFNEITKRGVKDAAKNPRSIDYNLVNAQQARRVLDRLVGYKISPLLQWGVRRGLSAGRVQSVAVRMVCEREEEIRNFQPVEYWTMDADFITPRSDTFTARLSKIKGEKAEIGSQAEMDVILAALEGVEYAVTSVEKKETRRRPGAPFITSTLQQEASRRLGYGPRRTMMIAQQLYEGINIGAEGTVGLITYMRTDSTRLADDAVSEVRGYIQDKYPEQSDARGTFSYLPEKPNSFTSKKDAQDAHEAIRPTSVLHTPDALAQYLSKEQLALYTVIWRRFLACQMAPAVLDQTGIDIQAAEYTFRASGSVMKFPGFTAVFEETTEEKADAQEKKEADAKGSDKPAVDSKDKLLPVINESEKLDLDPPLRPDQHFTKPPPRYSEATLIRALEENGIGRPSTYAPTINTVQERGYVEREQRRLKPTELGENVNKILIANFPDILNAGFTADMEAKLDRVEEGSREWHEIIGEFWSGFSKDLDKAQQRMVSDLVGDDTKCPTCGKDMEVREGRFGMYVACVDYPECKTTVRANTTKPEPTDEICDTCGAEMVIRSGRFGKFMACSAYPECKTTYNMDKDGNKIVVKKVEPKKTDQVCPDCKGTILIRTSRRGEEFYGCENYPKCKFTKPMELGLPCLREGCDGELVPRRRTLIGCTKHPDCDFSVTGRAEKEIACPKCGNSWVSRVKPRGKDPVFRCPKPDCDYEAPVPEEVEAGAEESGS